MKTPVPAILPQIRLERGASEPLHRQLYQALAQIVVHGRLRRGVPLPSSRRLAKVLGVSRNTVLAAYEELAADGVIAGRTGASTKVQSTTRAVRLRDPDGLEVRLVQRPSSYRVR